MSYIAKTMAPDEVILATGNFPLVYDLVTLLWFISIVGIPICINRMINKYSTELAVTSKRFVYKRGVIARRTDEFTSNRIKHISVRQTVMGRILNYGRVSIKGTDIDLHLPDISNPTKFRRALSLAAEDSIPHGVP